jgi:hypothetical protein
MSPSCSEKWCTHVTKQQQRWKAVVGAYCKLEKQKVTVLKPKIGLGKRFRAGGGQARGSGREQQAPLKTISLPLQQRAAAALARRSEYKLGFQSERSAAILFFRRK